MDRIAPEYRGVQYPSLGTARMCTENRNPKVSIGNVTFRVRREQTFPRVSRLDDVKHRDNAWLPPDIQTWCGSGGLPARAHRRSLPQRQTPILRAGARITVK